MKTAKEWAADIYSRNSACQVPGCMIHRPKIQLDELEKAIENTNHQHKVQLRVLLKALDRIQVLAMRSSRKDWESRSFLIIEQIQKALDQIGNTV